jgi:predicted outer membrane repeat protein
MRVTLKILIICSFIISAGSFVWGQSSAGNYEQLKALLETDTTSNKTINITGNINDFTDSIFVSGNINTLIDGQGFSFDGQNKSYFSSGFVVNSFLRFSNAQFKNFQVEDRGGAVFVGMGVGINLASVTYNTNKSLKSGGALYMDLRSSGSFTDVSFQGNSAELDGGGLYILNRVYVEFSTASASSAVFVSNNAKGSGGGFYISNSTSIFNSNVLFSQNSANFGGALYAQASDLVFKATTVFEKNSANFGGALYLSTMNVVFDRETSFLNNDANQSGGAGGAIYMTSANVVFSSVIFDANTANTSNGNGGGIFLSNNSSVEFIEITSFSSNKARIGGVFYLSNQGRASSMTFTKGGLFVSNNATYNGGVFYMEGGVVNIAYAFFENNSATNGGAIYISSGIFSISSGVFNKNTGSGGFLYMSGGEVNISTQGLNVPVLFSQNSGTNAGALYLDGGMLNISSVIFEGNMAKSGRGGAIYMTNQRSTINFSGAVWFSSNSANDGGALYLNGGAKMSFNNLVVFTSNSALNHGGAIYIESGSITFSTSAAFIYNGVTNNTGGAIHMTGANSAMIFNGDVDFTSNSAGGFSGGAVNIEGGVMIFNSSVSFSSNTAQRGGALYVGAGARVDILSGVHFIDNKATSGNGGAVYVVGLLNLDISKGNVIFLSNSASGAGNDIYATSGGTIAIRGAGVSNVLTLDGGIGMQGTDERNRPTLLISNATLNLSAASINTFSNIYLYLDNGVWNINTTSDFSLDGSKVFGTGTINKNSNNTITISSGFQSNSIDLNVNAGKVILSGKGVENNFSMSAKSLYIAQAATFSNLYLDISEYDNLKPSIINIENNVTINGTLEIFVNIRGRDAFTNLISAGGNVYLRENSKLKVQFIGIGVPDTSLILRIIESQTENGLIGKFGSIEYSGQGSATATYLSDALILSIKETPSSLAGYRGLSSNEETVAAEFDRMYADDYKSGAMSSNMLSIIYDLNVLGQTGKIEDLKKALDEFSGVSLVNALRLGAVESQGKIDGLYFNIDIRRDKAFWGNIFLQEYDLDDKDNSYRKFTSNGSGAQAGIDLYNDRELMGGVYLGYLNNSAKQGNDNIAIKDYEGGFYGGLFISKIKIKSHLAFTGSNNISRREINLVDRQYNTNANFDTYGIRFGAQVVYTIIVGYETDLEPFVGFRGGYTRNEEFSEFSGGSANLMVKENSYTRLDGIWGIGLGDDIGMFKWYAKAYMGYIFSGDRPIYQIRFVENGSWMDIEGAKEEMRGGAGAGVRYLLSGRSEGVSIFCNGDINGGTNMFGYYISAGLSYRY